MTLATVLAAVLDMDLLADAPTAELNHTDHRVPAAAAPLLLTDLPVSVRDVFPPTGPPVLAPPACKQVSRRDEEIGER